MSGIAMVAYNLARESAHRGLRTSLVSFSNGHDRMRSCVDNISVERIRHRSILSFPRIDLSYAGPLAWHGLRQAVDIAHIHSNPYHLRPLRAKCRVLHLHTPDFPSIPSYRKSVNCADAVIFCSAALMELATSALGTIEPTCYVVPNGVALERFGGNECDGWRFREQFGISHDTFLILFAGNLIEEKGPHVLIKALERLRDLTDRPFKLVIAGSSTLWKIAGQHPSETSYEHELVRFADPSLVTFIGALTQDEMPAAYAAADLFVCPSVWQEPLGIVIQEAMAAGKAVVASRVGGIPELVRDGGTGLLVEPDNPSALAQAIAACVNDVRWCAVLGEAGMRRAQDFSWPRIADTIQQIYERALRSAAGPGKETA
jgi:glycosyltransferase involved in cell wall biosynthesis